MGGAGRSGSGGEDPRVGEAEERFRRALTTFGDLIARVGDPAERRHLEELDGLEDRVCCRVAEAAAEVPYPLSVSIGVAHCEAGGLCTLNDLFERADRAMYRHKAAKRPDRVQRQADESNG